MRQNKVLAFNDTAKFEFNLVIKNIHTMEDYMKSQIALVTIWTDQIDQMRAFYHDIMGFNIKLDLGNYVEFHNEGVRFAICMREVMYEFDSKFKEPTRGLAFELAFPCDTIEEVDDTFEMLMGKGVKGIQPPKNMPWNQRTALFADPEGNIHEIFCEL